MSARIQYETKHEGKTAQGDLIPEGRILAVACVVVVPTAATHDEVLEWVSHSLGWGSISTANPLCGHSLDVESEPVLEDSGFTTDAPKRRREVFG